jgi:GNAT superfamily N-acetyltransferase
MKHVPLSARKRGAAFFSAKAICEDMNANKLQIPEGLGMRPARPSDSGFLEALHRSTRDDLRLIDAEDDFIEALIDMQRRAQTEGYGSDFPDAMHFVIEKRGEAIGRAVVDFGHNEVRLVDLAFIPKARGKGFGRAILQGLQRAATQVRAPLALTVMQGNLPALRLYAGLGFQPEEVNAAYVRMVWYPQESA